MYLKNGYSDALIPSEGRCRKCTNDDLIIIPRVMKSEFKKVSEGVVKRIGEIRVICEEQILNN